MTNLPQTAWDVKRAVESGMQCAGCNEPFAKALGASALCEFCYRHTPANEREGLLRAERALEQSVQAAKARHATRKPTE